jgi:hypothetical protein
MDFAANVKDIAGYRTLAAGAPAIAYRTYRTVLVIGRNAYPAEGETP